MKCKHKNYETFSCQGLNNETKKMNIADNFMKYNPTVMVIQETKIIGNEIHEVISLTRKFCTCTILIINQSQPWEQW